ncbi:hypothetical protein AAC387_Pa06g2074 [Persea americana]
MNRPVIKVLLLPILEVYFRNLDDFLISLPSNGADLIRSSSDDSVGTRWAVLIAGSSGDLLVMETIGISFFHPAICSKLRLQGGRLVVALDLKCSMAVKAQVNTYRKDPSH